MAILYVEGQQVSGAVDNAASISCLDKNGNKSNVQAELDKKGNGSGAGFEPVKMTQAEYDALPEEQQKSGAYLITDAKKLDALEVGFDGSVSGLNANNVQDAVDTLNTNMGGLRFGVDGEGNGGYFKADDSFVPFKSCVTGSFTLAVTEIDLGFRPSYVGVMATQSVGGAAGSYYMVNENIDVCVAVISGVSRPVSTHARNIEITDNGFKINSTLSDTFNGVNAYYYACK